MQLLNLPKYPIKIIEEGGIQKLFDPIRKRYVVLTPEEWVRQNFIQYLYQEKNYPLSLMAVEKQLKLHEKLFRFDLLIYTKNGEPSHILEFKAPAVKISQETFNQVVRYNYFFHAQYIMVSNGLQHFACKIDYKNHSVQYLKDIPEFY